jgi:hypothetical protein
MGVKPGAVEYFPARKGRYIIFFILYVPGFNRSESNSEGEIKYINSN